MRKWEYMVVSGSETDKEALDSHGAAGWELVSVVQTSEGPILGFFKRPKGDWGLSEV